MAEVRERAGDMWTRAKRRIGIENPSAAEDDSNVGIVRGALRAFGEGDQDAFIDAMKGDVTWETPGNNFPGGDELSGRDEVREHFIGDVGRTFTEFGFIPESWLDADDENAVVVFGRFHGDGVDGAALDVAGVQVWVFSGNEADHVRVYTDTSEFPEPITAEKQQKREEEEKKEQEEEQKQEEEEAKGEGDESSESESEESSESKSEQSSESKSEDQSESRSEESSESGGDSESEGESDSDKEEQKAESSS